MFIYFWKSTSGGGEETKEDGKSKVGSELTAQSLMQGLELTDREIMTGAEIGRSTDWATQAPLNVFF